MNIVIALIQPLRIGQTSHNFLALQVKQTAETSITINLEPEEIQKKYKNDLEQTVSGPLYEVISRLLKSIIGISVILPDGFRSNKGLEAVKCSCKTSDGYLYPLNTAFLFIYKPVNYIKHSEISSIGLQRISECLNSTGRTFDILIEQKKEGQTTTLSGIDKDEY